MLETITAVGALLTAVGVLIAILAYLFNWGAKEGGRDSNARQINEFITNVSKHMDDKSLHVNSEYRELEKVRYDGITKALDELKAEVREGKKELSSRLETLRDSKQHGSS